MESEAFQTSIHRSTAIDAHYPTYEALHKLASTTGGLPYLQEFLSTTLPSLPTSAQARYCQDASVTPCTLLPCTRLIKIIMDDSARGNQVPTFTYLYDTFLSPRKEEIPWQCLAFAARNGSLEFAKAFQQREEGWFDRENEKFHWDRPLTVSSPQLHYAIHNGHFEYVSFLLALGADINLGGLEQSIVRRTVTRDIDDDIVMERLKFLVGKGARVEGTRALEEAIKCERREDIIKILRECEQRELEQRELKRIEYEKKEGQENEDSREI